MKKIIALLAIVMALSGGLLFNSTPHYPDISTVAFRLIDGRRLDMQGLKGRPVLVTFWATSCAACIQEIPLLLKLYAKFKRKGLEIIAVAMPYDRPDHVLGFVQTRQLPYPVALDIDGKISRAFGNIRVTPNNFLIARHGGIIQQHTGIIDLAEAEQLLQSM